MRDIDEELQLRFIQLFGMFALHDFTAMAHTRQDIIHNTQYKQAEQERINGAASRQINTVPAKSPSAFFFLSMVFLPVFLHYIPPSMEIKTGTLLHVPDDNNYLPASSKARCAASKNCL